MDGWIWIDFWTYWILLDDGLIHGQDLQENLQQDPLTRTIFLSI